MGGVQLLELDASGPVAEVSASVECADQVYTGTIEALAAGTTVTVGFDPALPGVDYCTVTLSSPLKKYVGQAFQPVNPPWRA